MLSPLTKHNKYLIYAGHLFVAALVYLTMSANTGGESIVFKISFIWLFYLYYKLNKFICPKEKKLVITCALLSFFNVFACSLSLDFNYYNKLVMFICFLLLLTVSSSIYITRKDCLPVLVINLFICILYPLFFQSGFSLDEEAGSVFLTLGFTNSNLTGMFLLNSMLYVSILIIYAFEAIGKFFYRILTVALLLSVLAGLASLLYMTGCRSSMLSYVAFIALLLCEFTHKFKIKNAYIFLWSLFPLLFMFAYIYINESGISNLFDFSAGFEQGKTSDSRLMVWLPSLKAFADNWLMGDYYGISNGTGKSQLHNTHLDVLVSYGIIPFMLFVKILYNNIKRVVIKLDTHFNRICLYAFVVCWISGAFEAILVSGGEDLYVLTCGFLMLANSIQNGNNAYENSFNKLRS